MHSALQSALTDHLLKYFLPTRLCWEAKCYCQFRNIVFMYFIFTFNTSTLKKNYKVLIYDIDLRQNRLM